MSIFAKQGSVMLQYLLGGVVLMALLPHIPPVTWLHTSVLVAWFGVSMFRLFAVKCPTVERDRPSVLFHTPHFTHGAGSVVLRTFAAGRPPNMRLKLAGADRLKGSGVFVPWRARTVVQRPCAGERVARSLSAIR